MNEKRKEKKRKEKKTAERKQNLEATFFYVEHFLHFFFLRRDNIKRNLVNLCM